MSHSWTEIHLNGDPLLCLLNELKFILIYQTRHSDNYPHAFLKKRRGYCNRLRPSRYLLLNHWTKSNQIWCVSSSHEWGVQRHIFFAPPPGALGRGQKVKYHMGFAFGHLGHAQGWDLGVPWGVGVKKILFTSSRFGA